VTHSLQTLTVRLHDSRLWYALLHGEKTLVWADKRGDVSALREAGPDTELRE